ncbi:MAG TPA: hypothetical protein VKB43_04425 [Gaiellaceae bacterium]|nr:hypothetical protein [Gaiellaceae bacterium]
MKRLLLAAVVLAAVLAAPAAGGSVHHRSAYAGLGTWLDIYATSSWTHPQQEVSAMARDGVRTLYLQTGNYEQSGDLVRPQKLGQFIDAAHAAGMRVVAWYLPSFLYPAQDTRSALAAIHFQSAKGERFDSFALDIEASLVHSVPLRSKRLLQLSARLRGAVGRRYPLGAIIPSPVGIRRHPKYWPHFPYRSLAGYYNVFLPMAYSTDRHIHGVSATRAYNAADITIIRASTGKPHVPIHLIGGLANAMGTEEVAGFMRAVADCSPLGYSLYAFSVTRQTTWKTLVAPPARRQPCG